MIYSKFLQVIGGLVAVNLVSIKLVESKDSIIQRHHPSSQETLAVLIYETESVDKSPSKNLKDQAVRLSNVEASIFGEGQGFEGFGSKYAAVYPVLKKMPADQLVAIVDGRDVLINNPNSTDRYLESAVSEFRAAFEQLTAHHPGAIVISAEAQCCVSALSHAAPGDYYNKDGSRNERACASGEEGCTWAGDDKFVPWENFMKHLAIERTNQHYDDVFLNAGLIAGTAGDLVHMIEKTNIGKDEDDQAVLTDYMYRFPSSIVLDYGQTMFGNNRGGLNGEDSCTFTLPHGDSADVATERLTHMKTRTSPLFVHSPGGFLECHDALAAKLGIQQVSATARRRLKEIGRDLIKKCKNYGKPLLKECQSDCDCDTDCEKGLKCAGEHDEEIKKLGYKNYRKAYCPTGASKNAEVCYDPVNLVKKKPVKKPAPKPNKPLANAAVAPPVLPPVKAPVPAPVKPPSKLLKECQSDCDKDSDCATGLLCAAKHKSELTALGYDPRKAYCGKNAGAWNFEVCYDPKKLTKKPDVKPPTDDKKVTQG